MKIICTGGTIDSYYDVNDCTAICFENTVIPEYLEKTVRMDMKNVSVEQVCMKDSRAINDEDRAEVVRIIEESEDTEFVVTHGTYTLFQTARYLEEHLKRTDVTVTMTGSLIPLSGFAPTDAGFNLAGAMINSQYNKNGVYVYIKGQICKPGDELTLHI